MCKPFGNDYKIREQDEKVEDSRIDFPEKTPHQEEGVFGVEINSVRSNIRNNYYSICQI